MRFFRFFRTSIFRMSLLYVAVLAASLLMLLGFIYASTIKTIDQQTDDAIALELDTLYASYKTGGIDTALREMDDRLEWGRIGGFLYLITDESFRPLAGNLQAWPVTLDQQGKWLDFILDERLTGQRNSDAHHPLGARALTLPLGDDYYLLVGRDTREKDAFRRTMGHAVFWACLMVLGLGVGGGVFVSRRILRRIDSINRGAERIMRGGVKLRMPVTGSRDEFDRLAETLNQMLSEIERLMQSMQAVTTNLAHDLRSPLTRMKGKLELALADAATTPAHLRRTIEFAISESDQLLVTFNALLSIADAEGGRARDHMAPVDLHALAMDAVEFYEPVADEKNITLQLGDCATFVVQAHRQLLFQAISNLIENAIKYARPHDTITVRVYAEGRAIHFTVADTGPGIPPDQYHNVLERFTRLDESRTTQGNGLGLALVAAIARLHQATLVLSPTLPASVGDDGTPVPPSGLTVTLGFTA